MGGGGDLSWTRRGGQSLSTLPRVRRVFCGPGLGLLGSEGGLNEGQVRKRWVTEEPRLQGPDQGGEQGRVERAVSCRVVRLWLGAPEGICACMSDCEN